MARSCVKITLGDNEYKLRLTLRGQKKLKERNPEISVIAAIMSAVDEPEDMEVLLTQALSWEGNRNKIHDGAALYDELVDHGYSGSEDFLGLCMDIAKNAGLVTEDEKSKLDRAIKKQLARNMDAMEVAMLGDEEGEERPDNPPPKFQTLDG